MIHMPEDIQRVQNHMNQLLMMKGWCTNARITKVMFHLKKKLECKSKTGETRTRGHRHTISSRKLRRTKKIGELCTVN